MTAGEKIGKQIKELRLRCGLTQEMVANELDISLSYYRKIEHGDANPTVNMAEKIVSYLESYLRERKQKGGH